MGVGLLLRGLRLVAPTLLGVVPGTLLAAQTFSRLVKADGQIPPYV